MSSNLHSHSAYQLIEGQRPPLTYFSNLPCKRSIFLTKATSIFRISDHEIVASCICNISYLYPQLMIWANRSFSDSVFLSWAEPFTFLYNIVVFRRKSCSCVWLRSWYLPVFLLLPLSRRTMTTLLAPIKLSSSTVRVFGLACSLICIIGVLLSLWLTSILHELLRGVKHFIITVWRALVHPFRRHSLFFGHKWRFFCFVILVILPLTSFTILSTLGLTKMVIFNIIGGVWIIEIGINKSSYN